MNDSYDTFLQYLAYLFVAAGIIGIGVKVFKLLTRKKKGIKRGLVKRF